MKLFVRLMVVGAFVWVLCAGFLSAWDRQIFPGAQVVEQEGDLLKIELDKEYLVGSDGACQAAGQIIESICRQGYRVQVVNWPGLENKIIGLEVAREMARGY